MTKEERLGLLDVYIARASEFFGVAKVRCCWLLVAGRDVWIGSACLPKT